MNVVCRYDWTGVDEFIEKNIKTMTYKQMAEELGFSAQVLRDHARRAGFSKYKWVDWTDEIIDYMKAHYKDGAPPIAKRFGIPITAINKKAQSLGLKVIPKDCYIDANGYKMLGKSNNRIAEHRLVMEKHLGRKLTSEDIVHHIDGNKLNNDISNLCLTTRADHIEEHREELLEALRLKNVQPKRKFRFSGKI